MQHLAKELVELRPDLIVASTTPATAALHRETRTLPIVFVTVSDPIGAGLVASLSRPGATITGFINLEPTMGGKWLELLKEIAPRIMRVGICSIQHSTLRWIVFPSLLRSCRAVCWGLGNHSIRA